MIGFAPRSKLPSKRVSLAAMPPLRDALRMRGPETDWADRRGWLSMSELLRIPQQLGKMSCFGVTMDKEFAISVAFTGLCSYLLWVFILLQLNPAEWERVDRVAMVATWALSLVFSRMIRSHI